MFKNSAKMRVLGSDQVNPGPSLVLQIHEARLVVNPHWLDSVILHHLLLRYQIDLDFFVYALHYKCRVDFSRLFHLVNLFRSHDKLRPHQPACQSDVFSDWSR